jgi:hypothetical protein
MAKSAHHSEFPAHRHAPKPVDGGYRLVVRTVLWVIVGAVFVGFVLWWFMT